MKLFKKLPDFVPLVLILILAAVLRILFLNSVPGALGGDELHYILTIKSIALTGADLYGPWNIFSIFLFNYPAGTPQAEASYFLLYPLVSLTGLSLFTSKITFALLSVATVFAVYLLGKTLFNRITGLVAAFICAVTPWQVFIGRTSYEVVPAICFYLFGTYFLLRGKSWRILISLPFFILAFYSYIGTKTVLVPLVIAVSAFAYFSNKKKFLKQYVVLNVLCLVLVGFFALTALGGGNSRTSGLFLPNNSEISRIVDESRKGSIAPTITDSLLTNKVTVYGKIATDKFLTIFSPTYLFVSADNFVGIYNHGLFLAIDFVLIVFGLLLMFSEKRKTFGLFIVLLVISTFPQVFYETRTDIFSPHLALFLVFLVIPIAYGISYLLEKKKYIILGIVAVLYIISVVNFLNIYFFQFPLTGHFDLATRVMSNYVVRAQESGTVNVYVQSPSDSFTKYIYYTNKLNKDNVSAIQKAIKNKDYKVENVIFEDCADIPETASDSAEVSVIQRGACKKVELTPLGLRISALTDGGEQYAIYNDRLCSNFALKPYPDGIKLADFNIESLSSQKFCEVFISK